MREYARGGGDEQSTSRSGYAFDRDCRDLPARVGACLFPGDGVGLLVYCKLFRACMAWGWGVACGHTNADISDDGYFVAGCVWNPVASRQNGQGLGEEFLEFRRGRLQPQRPITELLAC